jgi:hypothetical protein
MTAKIFIVDFNPTLLTRNGRAAIDLSPSSREDVPADYRIWKIRPAPRAPLIRGVPGKILKERQVFRAFQLGEDSKLNGLISFAIYAKRRYDTRRSPSVIN